MSEHSINELSALSGLSIRTIRYYLAQGLIPSADKEGPATRYPDATLARLRLITKLQGAHLPLAEIRKQLAALSDGQVLDLIGSPAEPEPDGSALDYVRSLLGSGGPVAEPRATSLAMSAPADAAAPPEPALRRSRVATDVTPAAPVSPADAASPFGQRSQWDRVALAPDVELHIRRPLSRRDNKMVERLIAFARQLQGEDKP